MAHLRCVQHGKRAQVSDLTSNVLHRERGDKCINIWVQMGPSGYHWTGLQVLAMSRLGHRIKHHEELE